MQRSFMYVELEKVTELKDCFSEVEKFHLIKGKHYSNMFASAECFFKVINKIFILISIWRNTKVFIYLSDQI